MDSRQVRVLVIGGDRFGEYHERQLRRAGYGESLEVVESDWGAALEGWLAEASPEDQVVPAPLSPHFLRDWLRAAVGGVPIEAPRGWALPFEVAGSDGSVYLSAAAWTCPATCVEPAHCPALHAPRDWDLGSIIEEGAAERGFEAVVFRVLHFAAGVATVGAASLLAARDGLRARPGARVVVATSSRCHAALGSFLVPAG
jgi:hypothetical protein